MKALCITALIFLFACASTPPPKETVQDIFSLIKDGRIRQAEDLYGQTPDGVPFEVYGDNKAISAREMDRLVSASIDFINSCEILVEKAKTIATDYNPVYSDPIDPVKAEFDQKCNVQTNKSLEADLKKVKTISNVDFTPDYELYQKQFLSELAKIESILGEETQIQQRAEEKAAKTAEYERSPEFYVKKLCEMNDRVKLGNTVIAKENESGRISGYVDKRKLYEAGKVVQANQEKLKHFTTEYKKKFNKNWTESYCK